MSGLYRCRVVVDVYVTAEDEGHAKDVVSDALDDLMEVNRVEKYVTLYNHSRKVEATKNVDA